MQSAAATRVTTTPPQNVVDGTLGLLQKNAPRFDLDALLHALFACGFDWRGIQFEGVRSLGPSSGPFVRSLRIIDSPAQVAIVSLNAGLLAGASPLPSYFFEFARRLAQPDEFISFLGFWDAVQLKDHAVSLLPELGADPTVLGRAHLARMNRQAPVHVHSLFRAVFPELAVLVRVRLFEKERRSERARIGTPLTGRLVLGARFLEAHRGIGVVLQVSSQACEGVADWEEEAHQRIDRIEAFLRTLKLPIEIVLHFEEYRFGHSLVNEVSERPQLGVRPWLSSRPGQSYGEAMVVVRGPWARQRHVP